MKAPAALQKRRRVNAKESTNLNGDSANQQAASQASQRSLRSKNGKKQNPESQENHPADGGKAPTEVLSASQIQALTVPKLREICVLNNLGGEKALKKELVNKVTQFYAQK